MVRILIVKLGSLGDVVHTLPALSALKRAFPEAEIDWLVEPKSAVILKSNPLLHEVIEVDTLQWRKALWRARVLRQIKTTVTKLRNRHYDLALDFQGLWKSAAFAHFSGAKLVTGFDRVALKEPGCRIFYDRKVAPRKEAVHVIDILNELVRSLGIENNGYRFDLAVPAEDRAYITAQLAAHHLSDFVILNPGGGWVTKNWDAENYAKLHLSIRKVTGLQCVVTWGPGEEDLVREIVRCCEGDPPVTFPTTIFQLVALVQRARLFVGGDTGPLHLATACNTPVVGIFGPTESLRNGPFSRADLVVSRQVPCGPCYKRTCPRYNRQCMRLITAEEVFEAVMRRLTRNESSVQGAKGIASEGR